MVLMISFILMMFDGFWCCLKIFLFLTFFEEISAVLSWSKPQQGHTGLPDGFCRHAALGPKAATGAPIGVCVRCVFSRTVIYIYIYICINMNIYIYIYVLYAHVMYVIYVMHVMFICHVCIYVCFACT